MPKWLRMTLVARRTILQNDHVAERVEHEELARLVQVEQDERERVLRDFSGYVTD